jgi:hypothetical protein
MNLLLSLLFFATSCWCSDVGVFLSPPGTPLNDHSQNSVWYVGERHTLKWQTMLVGYNVSLFQKRLDMDDYRDPMGIIYSRCSTS